ncbi:MAG: SpvB/TcaC N-terminal domain-containing protein [Janthinobacterium lividum]
MQTKLSLKFWGAVRVQQMRAIAVPVFIGILLLASPQPSSGQSTTNGAIPTIIPPSPTAAALEKYGQVPVSTYTGVPNISVPLYEIKVRDLSIPISLSYHAGGFRVSEEASWVGLGWSLQAGGAITRTVRNLDDLTFFIPRFGQPKFTMPEPISPFGYNTNNPSSPGAGSAGQNGNPLTGIMGYVNDYYDVYIKDPADSTKVIVQQYGQQGVFNDVTVDWEPDDFRFTAGNYSGQFAFDQKGRIHILEQQKIAIESPAVTGQSYWKVITPDGFQYFYGAGELSGTASPDPIQGNAITAWYLTRMISPTGEEAKFTYEQGANVQMQPMLSQSEIKQYADCGDTQNNPQSVGYSTALSQSGLVPQYLSRIDFKTGYVLFDRDMTTTREDLQGAQRLKRIAVYSLADELQKEYVLQTSYFVAPAGNIGYTTPSPNNLQDLTNPYEGKRLRLDAIVEKGSDGRAKPATIFAYNPTALPVKSSYSVDFWGYYNGITGIENHTLIPRYAGPDLYGDYISYQGAIRTPNADAMQACILQKITYPTGGSTTFTFEPHEYGNITETDIQTSTVLATLPIRFRADNVDPTTGNIPSTRFTVTEPTPINILKYDLWVENANNKQYTYLHLIDESTNQPYKYTPTNGSTQYFTATWYFPPANAPDPNTPSNPYSTDYSNPYNNPNRITGSAQFVVPPGSYHFEARLPNCNSQDAGQCRAIVEVVQAYYSQLQTVPVIQSSSIKLLAGGLRVKRIETYDGLTTARNQVQLFQYGAGTLMTQPVFKKVALNANGTFICRSLKLSSNSFAAFSAGAKGSSVGYSQVDVLQGLQGEGGKTSYIYHNLEDRRIDYGDRQSNIPTRSDELNGSLLAQKTYRKASDGFHLVSATENAYEVVNKYDVPAIFRGEKYSWPNGVGITKGQRMFYYPIPARWVRLVSTVSRQYDPQDETKFLSTVTRYTYDTLQVGHMQVSQVRTRRSDGSTLLTTSTYPGDYKAVTSGPLSAMRSMGFYQQNAVVETRTQLYGPTETATAAKTVAGSFTEFIQPNSISRFLPSTFNTLEITQPTAGIPLAVPNLPPVGFYARKHKILYESATANIQQEQKEHALPTVFLWGYNSTLPVAQVQLATLAQVQAALGSVDVNTLITDQQLRDTFQQLRQRLPQAQITSFTYAPLVGITSKTDPTGRTITYEYDGLQRLVRTRDEQNRILSQQQYHYTGTK